MAHLKHGEVSNIIRGKCGLQPVNEESKMVFFTREEQLVILAHIVKIEELLKTSVMDERLVKEISDRVVEEIRVRYGR